MLIRTSELGCRALIEIAFESVSVRRQVGHLTLLQLCGGRGCEWKGTVPSEFNGSNIHMDTARLDRILVPLVISSVQAKLTPQARAGTSGWGT